MEKTREFLALIGAIASICGFLFGFDMAVISGMLPHMHAQFSLTSGLEGWLVSSALVGCMCGVTLFLASFAFSTGLLKFVVTSEIFPATIRGKALGISIIVMWVANAIMWKLTAITIRKFGAAFTFCLTCSTSSYLSRCLSFCPRQKERP